MNNKGSILVVDNYESFREGVAGIVESEGYEALLAENGRVALDLVRKVGGSLRLVITDFNMQEMNGLQLTQETRSLYPVKPSIVMISGTDLVGEDPLEELARDAGVNQFLPRSGSMLQAIRAAIRSHAS